MTGLIDVTQRIVAIFEQRQIPYAIMGGLAVRAYALPRPTFDVDFTALIARDSLPELFDAVEAAGFNVAEPQKSGWVDSVRGMPIVNFQWFVDQEAIDVDLFLAETEFQSELLKRRCQHETDGFTGWYVSPEDLILLKLVAGRPKDWADILDILLIQGPLDEHHLARWAKALNVSEGLKTAFEECGR